LIFDEGTLRKLNALTLVAERVRVGRLRGDRRSSKRGSSIEFADFRNYVPGDDLRRLDWNIYARLDRPFIKLFEDEEDLAVYTILDGSASMDWGDGEENKYNYGRRLAGAFGSIALNSGDAFAFDQLAVDRPARRFGPTRGNQNTLRFLSFLESLKADGKTALNESLLNFTFKNRRPGLIFLISDLMDEAGYESGITQLLSRGNQVVLIHLLAPEELNPTLRGDLKLIDKEFDTSQEVSLDPVILQAYRQQAEKWLDGIRSFCRSRDINYVQTTTAFSWDQFILNQLRREGIVK
jgi:uncharacterized protein (DUF58 family)